MCRTRATSDYSFTAVETDAFATSSTLTSLPLWLDK
jgi:hypothetical protein